MFNLCCVKYIQLVWFNVLVSPPVFDKTDKRWQQDSDHRVTPRGESPENFVPHVSLILTSIHICTSLHCF